MFDFWNNKKVFSIALIFVLALPIITLFLSQPNKVYAQSPVVASIESQERIDDIMEDVEMKTDDAMKVALISSLTQGISYLTRKFAHDAAVFLASGATGQNPQVYEDGFGNYMKKISGEAAIQSVNNLTKRAGLNICEIPSVEFMANLKVNLATIYEQGVGPKPDCSMADIKSNWTNCSPEEARDPSVNCSLSADKFMKKNSNLKPENMAKQFVSDFKEGFTAEGSDFGVEMTAMGRIGDLVAEEKEAKKNARLEGDGFKPVSGAIDNEVKTPAHFVKKESEVATGKRQLDLTNDQLNSMLGSNSLAALTQAGDVFVSTLASRLLDKVMNDGLLPDGGSDSSGGGNGGGVDNEFASYSRSSREAAEQAFAFFTQKIPSTDVRDFETVSTLFSCPDGPAKSMYNCVIDGDLHQALVQAQQGEALTIKEALGKGYLHANWPLIPPERKNLNMKDDCRDGRYCYTNAKKLRKLRIFPLGFEIATMLGNPDTPSSVTLGKVVENFNNCNENGRRDAAHPYCHLVDPNWVIKAPAAKCEMEDYGSVIVSENSAVRKEMCSDISTCTVRDESGQCMDYGYCTREKSIWDVPGQSCDAQYATCKTYFDNDGKASSYLSRTIDFGICSPNSVGCRAYSLTKSNGEWKNSESGINNVLKKNGRNQNIYFNQNINNNTCSAEDRGCSEFLVGTINLAATGNDKYNKTNRKVHIKKAPAYLGCYDANSKTEEIEWPSTIPQAKLATASNNSCQNFSKACVESEVGCKSWESVSNSNLGKIPGKIGANSCNEKCVGYDVYYQEETVFEAGKDKNYFIPDEDQVRECEVEDSGCSEFTNLSGGGTAENLEYYTDLQYCENPEENNMKTYYTWEGSSSQGYKIRKHERIAQYTTSSAGNFENDLNFIKNQISSSSILDEFEAGSPKYSFDTIDQLKGYYKKCNANTYEKKLRNQAGAAPANCREYRDQKGNIYYRIQDKLLKVSNQCHKLRKTETNLVKEGGLKNQDLCESRGGKWESGQCFVCRGGGTYTDNNFCVYQTISTPGGQYSCQGPTNDPDKYNGCRPYRGNKSGNERIVISDDFEPSGSQSLSEAKAGWTGSVQVVGEALEVGGHSLRASSDASREIDPNTFVTGTDANYEISFWARGSNETFTVHLEQNQGTNQTKVKGSEFTYDKVSEQNRPVSISGDWKQFQLGPVNFNGDPSVTTTLVLDGLSGSGQIYIDKFKMTEGESKIYVIKDSWEREVSVGNNTLTADVPLVCDSNPQDNLPGQALGCSLYEDSQNNQQAATGFEKLCRENAVGCRPVYDTYNSTEIGATWYNAVCKRQDTNKSQSSEATNCQIKIKKDKFATNYQPDEDAVLGECTISEKKDSCYVSKVSFRRSLITEELKDYRTVYDNLYKKHVNESTVVVPEDDFEDSPKFMTITKDVLCSEDKKGCRQIGQQKRNTPDSASTSFSFDSEMYVLNDPDNYVSENGDSGTLCQAGQIGCKQYNSGDQTVYFKDPSVRGNICVYKEGVPVEGREADSASGWFMKEVGKCSNNDNLCKEDSDCGGENSNATCQYKGQIPCYKNSQTSGNSFRIWSEDSNQYNGFVGSCPIEQNQCREFVDPADRNENHPNGKPYYRIMNESIEQARSECNGEVSQKAGCVLFNQTEDPEKLYNSKETYKESKKAIEQDQPDSLVEPVKRGNLDSNIILKVDQDRQCAEWLTCMDSRTERKPDGKILELCTDYSLCTQVNKNGTCTGLQDLRTTGYCSNDTAKTCTTDSECSANGVCIETPQEITINRYANRDVSWYSLDFSGMSILNSRNIGNYIQVNLPDSEKKFLAYKVPDDHFINTNEENNTVEYLEEGCVEDQGDIKENWKACGFDGRGRCFDGSCIKSVNINKDFPPYINSDNQSINTSTLKIGVKKGLSTPSCRVYPEADSPFPQSVLTKGGRKTGIGNVEEYDSKVKDAPKRFDFIKKKPQYSKANICQNAGECSCSYTKIQYKNGITDYWSQDYIKNRNVDITGFGICGSGIDEGKLCKNKSNCSGGSECVKPESIDQKTGMFGHCLERDYATPIGEEKYACLTWYPSDVSATKIDVYNNDPTAGYYPGTDAKEGAGQVYCLQSTGRAAKVVDNETYGFSSDSSNVPSFQFPEVSKIDDLVIGYYEKSSGGNIRSVTKNDIKFKMKKYGVVQEKVSLGKNKFFPTVDVSGESGMGNNEEKDSSRSRLQCDDKDTTLGAWGNGMYQSAFETYACNLHKVDSSNSFAEENSRNSTNDVNYDYGFGNGSSSAIDLLQKEFISAMKIFARKYLINETASYSVNVDGALSSINAKLLRLELSGERSIGSRQPAWGRKDEGSGEFKSKEQLLTSFAPAIRGDSGVMMHPPRSFDSKPAKDKKITPPGRIWSGGKSTGFRELKNNKKPELNIKPLSPDYSNDLDNISSPIGSRDNYLYISPAEKELIEQELDAVYFIPLRFPMGEEGINPAMGTQQFMIDFNELRKRHEDENKKAVIKILPAEQSWDNQISGRKGGNGCQINTGGKNSGHEYYGHRDCNKQFDEKSPKENGAVIQYLQQDDPNDPDDDIIPQYENNGERNRIFRRYTTIFYGKKYDKNAPFVVDDPLNLGAGNNPFSKNVGCGSYRNWYALGMDFNEKGEFLGYVVRSCHTYLLSGNDYNAEDEDTVNGMFESDDDGEWAQFCYKKGDATDKETCTETVSDGLSGIQFATFAQFNDRCVDYNSVYKQNIGAGISPNKAFTNRVWNNSTYTLKNYNNLSRSKKNEPFGSSNLVNSDISNRDSLQAKYQLLSQSVYVTPEQGVALSCSATTIDDLNPNRGDDIACYAQNDRNIKNNDSLLKELGLKSERNSKITLQNLFAKTFSRQYISVTNSNKFNYSSSTFGNKSTFDVSNNGGRTGYRPNPPKIYSVNPYTCLDSESRNRKCSAGEENNFTINQTTGLTTDYNDDDQPDYVSGKNQQWKGLIGNQVFSATARFFAYADHNQMPLKRILIDWGDDDLQRVYSKMKYGKYKNRKPYCGSAQRECTGTQITCRTDKDCPNNDQDPSSTFKYDLCQKAGTNFGNSARGCKEEYFTYRHTYKCGPTEMSQIYRGNASGTQKVGQTVVEAADGNQTILENLKEKGLSESDKVCVFKPRIQVLDNWDWCNGNCNGTDGCYNDNYRGGKKLCRQSEEAWTSFKGKIIVIPAEKYR